MSFSSDIKDELCRFQVKENCCIHSECYGMWLFSKCFTKDRNAYTSENSGVTTRMAEFAAITAGVFPEITFAVSRRKKPAYKLSIPNDHDRETLINSFGHSGKETNLRINRANFECDMCVSAFLRGAFLSCASATDPNKEYHLEFSSQYRKLSVDLMSLISEIDSLELSPSITNRKGKFIVYLKDSGQMEDFLTYIGAPGASMQLMQVKMYKEAKNDINRKANFETANMDKTYNASARQIASIAFLNDTKGLDFLPKALEDLARFRLNNPEMSLREISEQFGLTKSGVNHRMNKILQTAKENGFETL